MPYLKCLIWTLPHNTFMCIMDYSRSANNRVYVVNNYSLASDANYACGPLGPAIYNRSGCPTVNNFTRWVMTWRRVYILLVCGLNSSRTHLSTPATHRSVVHVYTYTDRYGAAVYLCLFFLLAIAVSLGSPYFRDNFPTIAATGFSATPRGVDPLRYARESLRLTTIKRHRARADRMRATRSDFQTCLNMSDVIITYTVCRIAKIPTQYEHFRLIKDDAI